MIGLESQSLSFDDNSINTKFVCLLALERNLFYHPDTFFVILVTSEFTFSLSISRVVERLLKHDASIRKRDKQGFTPLHYAALNGHKLAIEMVSKLLLHFPQLMLVIVKLRS